MTTAWAADIGSIRKALENHRLNGEMLSAERAIGGPESMTSVEPDPHVVPYGLWGARWWQWVFSIPVHDSRNNITHPLLATGAVDCSIGQFGPVWFLAGNITGGPTTRSCTIPRNTLLFFPILNAWADNTGVDKPTDLSIAELKALVADGSAALPGSLHASVDGVPIPITSDNQGAALFAYEVPNKDNLLQFFGEKVPGPGWPFVNTPIGTFVAPAASDGTWLLLNPLSPGTHKVNFVGTSASTPSFSLNIVYTITVK
jgi:hypothetical protein